MLPGTHIRLADQSIAYQMKRYESLAHDMAESIASGVFRPGDRLPSVRETSESRGVSTSTVFQAYYLLEARGLVEARARSGYYVSHASAARWYPAANSSDARP